MSSADVEAALKVSFIALYLLLLVIGVATCFLGSRAVRRWRRTIYFISLFVLTNFIVLPLCWIVFRFMSGTNDKLAIGALALLSTLLAWRISGFREATIVQVYGTLIGGLLGVVVGAFVGFATPSAWVVQVSLWLGGGFLGWLFANRQPDFSKVVFFAAAGAATAAQSVLGLYEIGTGRSVPEVAITRVVQLFFPILYVIFSSFSFLQFLFLLATLLLFLAGLRVQCAHLRSQLQGAPSLCGRFEHVLPNMAGRARRLIWRRDRALAFRPGSEKVPPGTEGKP